MKDLCQKWTVKLIFRGAYRLSGTGIFERNHSTIKWMAARRGWEFPLETDPTDHDPHISTPLTFCALSTKRTNLTSPSLIRITTLKLLDVRVCWWEKLTCEGCTVRVFFYSVNKALYLYSLDGATMCLNVRPVHDTAWSGLRLHRCFHQRCFLCLIVFSLPSQ